MRIQAAPGAASRSRGHTAYSRPVHRELTGFVARFVAGWVVALLLLARVPAFNDSAMRLTVAQVVATARLLRAPAEGTANTVLVAGASIRIVPDCTPVMPITTLWVAIIAFPTSWRSRALGMGIGGAVLWLYNLARILALVPVLRFRPTWFGFIHVYLWQTVTMLVILGLFLTWLRFQSHDRASA